MLRQIIRRLPHVQIIQKAHTSSQVGTTKNLLKVRPLLFQFLQVIYFIYLVIIMLLYFDLTYYLFNITGWNSDGRWRLYCSSVLRKDSAATDRLRTNNEILLSRLICCRKLNNFVASSFISKHYKHFLIS